MVTKQIETKMGTIYLYKVNDNNYMILDSVRRWIYRNLNEQQAEEKIKMLQSFNSVGEWLEDQEDVCWGSHDDILNYTRDYHECNHREFDEEWFEDNWNKIGKTYIMFEYSEAHK